MTYPVTLIRLKHGKLGELRRTELTVFDAEVGEKASSLFALARCAYPWIPRHEFALEGFKEQRPYDRD